MDKRAFEKGVVYVYVLSVALCDQGLDSLLVRAFQGAISTGKKASASDIHQAPRPFSFSFLLLYPSHGLGTIDGA